MKKTVPLSRPYFDDCEIERITAVLDGGCVGGTCPEVKNFEEKFAETVGTKYAIATSNCTVALHASLLALVIGKGDEVIIPSFTHPATGFAVAHCQAKPVLADVSLNTYTINPEDIRSGITEKTKAICPVYAFGMPPDVFEILEIADEKGLKIVWDTATGLGAMDINVNAGNFSDCECFSLFPTKIISTGEGGMITTDDKEIAVKAHALVNFGKGTGGIGYNYRLSAIQAAIGLCQLEKLPNILESRKEVAKYYKKRILEEASSLYWLHPQIEPENVKSAWQRFVCIVHHKDKPELRDNLMEHLHKNGIETTFGTHSLALQPFFKDNRCCPNANFLYRNTIALPLYYGMGKEDVDYVVERLVEFYKSSFL